MIDGEFLSTMIGTSGIAILRKWSLIYMLSNEVAKQAKISTFADFVEGELKHQDVVVNTLFPIETYIDSEDMQSIIHQSKQLDTELIDQLYEVLQQRIEDQEIGGIFHYAIDTRPKTYMTALWTKVTKKQYFKKMKDFWTQYQQYLLYWLLWCVMIWTLLRAVQSYQWTVSTDVVDTTGEVVQFTIDDIKREIQEFDRIAVDSDTKLPKYESIQAKLAAIEAQGKQQADVIEMKKILDEKYFQWFNTTLMPTSEDLGNVLYMFSDQEKNILGDVHSVFWKNGLFIWWVKGVLLHAINPTTRWVLIESPVGKTLNHCGANLTQDGLYCQDSSYQVHDVSRQWFIQLSVQWNNPIPVWLKQIATYLTTNIFALVQDATLNEKWVYLLRYKFERGSKDILLPADEYSAPGLAWSWNGMNVTSLAIDGSFLMWDDSTKELRQFWRDGNDLTMKDRVVPMAGWNAITQDFSSNVRIYTANNTSYVYLLDIDNQSFIAYRSIPLKDRQVVDSDYTLQYFYSFKFAMGDILVKDVFIRHGEKPIAYFLTNQWVFETRLFDYVQKYTREE